MSEIIGAKIKQLRKSKGLTQDELSKRVDIKRSTISNYEIGHRTPRLKDLQKMSQLFGVGLDYFGIDAKDEAFDLLARAKEVFKSPAVDHETKEKLYMDFMRLYLEMKGEENDEKENTL